jgi:hypothetical protein
MNYSGLNIIKECFNSIVVKGIINRFETFLVIIVPTFSFFYLGFEYQPLILVFIYFIQIYL